jgi:hemoglobin/transferrin/lactoferrin receptor protein
MLSSSSKRSRCTNQSFTFALGLVVTGLPAAAQEIKPLPEVIVSATRSREALLEVPYSAVVLTQDELRRQGARSLPDALRFIPGVLIQKTSAGQGSPYVRGFTGFRTLAMVDGIRLNNSVYRDGPNQYWNTIDVMGLEAIELTKGQGSVLYGSDAIGGTLNARTRGPVFAPAAIPSEPGTSGKNPVSRGGPSTHFDQPAPFATGGAIRGRYASGERSWQGRVEGYASQGQNAGIFLGATVKDFGDVEAAGLGRLPRTGYGEYDLDGKLEWRLDHDLTLTLAHQQVHQDDVWRTHRTLYSKPWSGTSVGSEQVHLFDQDRYLSYARLDGGDGTGAVEAFQFTLSHQRQGEDRYRMRAPGDDRRDEEGFVVDTFGATLQFVSDTPVGRLTYGADYYLDLVDSYQRRFDAEGNFAGSGVQGPVADDARYHLAGAFIQNAIALNERTELTLGGRMTYARADADRVADPLDSSAVDSLDEDWTTVVGSARLSRALDDDRTTFAYAGISQGFRAPNLSDLTRFDIARSNEIETPSPNLDPEEFLTYELGLKAEHERFSGECAVFFTDIHDMIVRQPTGAVIDGANEVRKRNAGEGYVYGVEVGIAWEFVPQWSLFANFAWQDGRVDGYPTSGPDKVEEPVSRLLPATSLIGLRWTSADEQFWLEGSVQLVDRADRLNASDRADTQRIPPGGTPGYTVASVRAGWKIRENIMLTAAVENVFDEEYRFHGSGQNEPGVNAIVGVDWSF